MAELYEKIHGEYMPDRKFYKSSPDMDKIPLWMNILEYIYSRIYKKNSE